VGVQRVKCFIALAGLLASAAVARADVAVEFANPLPLNGTVHYPRSQVERVEQGLQEHLQRLGERYLASDRHVRIEVLEIDLAGRDNTLLRHPEVRVLRGSADWPGLKLRYSFSDPRGVRTQQIERISDLDYLERINPYRLTDPLRYEKRMLDEWFITRFGPGS
jgi:hypothetical protein